jgi:hypothetical protein
MDGREKPYIRWYVPRWSGPARVVDLSKRRWLFRVGLVTLMWAALIALFAALEGLELAAIFTFLAALIVGGLAFHGWHSGREAVGEAPKPFMERFRRKKG